MMSVERRQVLVRSGRGRQGRLAGVLLLAVLSVMAGRAGLGRAAVVTGNPGGSLAGSIPVTATVSPYANLTWLDCLFPAIHPPSGGACTGSLQVATNTDISLRFSAIPLRNTLNSSVRLLSQYTIQPPTGSALTVNPDTGQTAQAFQVGSALDNLKVYGISGSAQHDSATTVAGSYLGQLQVTLVAAASDLSVPSGLSATAGDTQLTATWNAVSGATAYELAYQAGGALDPAAATIVTVTGTSRTLTGLTNGQVYSLAVRSVVGSTKSGWSAAIQATPQSASVGLARDARALAGVSAGSCAPSGWTAWFYTADGACAGTSYAAATAIESNGYNGTVTGATTTFSSLPAGTYTVWAYLKAQASRSVRVRHNGQTITAALSFTTTFEEPCCYAWYAIGTLTLTPAQSVSLELPGGGGNPSAPIVYVRSLALKATAGAPSIVPTGNGGDQALY